MYDTIQLLLLLARNITSRKEGSKHPKRWVQTFKVTQACMIFPKYFFGSTSMSLDPSLLHAGALPPLGSSTCTGYVECGHVASRL